MSKTQHTYTSRVATASDQPLLLALFTSNKTAEFASLGLSSQQLQSLLDMQYRAREVSYAQAYPAAVDMVLCINVEAGLSNDIEKAKDQAVSALKESSCSPIPVGRHLVERQSDCYRCIDIAVLPQFQGQGIGAWALRQVQQFAEREGVPFRLSVFKNNPAARLYERLGFNTIASNDVFYEMEWQPTTLHSVQPRIAPQDVSLFSGDVLPRAEVVDQIVRFLHEIGLTIELSHVPPFSFLPGIQPIANGLRIDTAVLLYPGDLLHEAGHLAVMTPEQRSAEFPSSNEPAQEIAALAWSYAAALHIGLPPEVVFHENGYRGQSRLILQGFSNGTGIGVPYLWWIGLTTQSFPDQPSIFPRMIRWLRETGSNPHPISEEPVMATASLSA